MNKKVKKTMGASLTGVMALSCVAGSVNSLEPLKTVSAASSEVSAVHSKIEHITNSLKSNYLGLKNVGQWQAYIKEAKALNAKLPNGSTKDKFSERINKAESLVNAAARVNQVEKSMESNAKVMKNIPQWESYISLAKEDLSKVDLGVFKAQYNSLLERTSERVEAIESIKVRFQNDLKAVESLLKEAEELSNKDKEKALLKLEEAKTAADKLDTHTSKEEILKKIQTLTSEISNGTTKPDDNKDQGSSSNGSNSSSGDTGSNTGNLKNANINSKEELSKLQGDYGTITIDSSIDGDALISNVRAVNVVVSGGSEITFSNSKIDNLTVNKEGTVIKIDGNTEIINTMLNASATIDNGAVTDVSGGEIPKFLSTTPSSRAFIANNIARTNGPVIINKIKTVTINNTGKTVINVKVEKIIVLKSSVNPVEINKEVGDVEVNSTDANVSLGASAQYVKVLSKSNIIIKQGVVVGKLESLTTNPFNLGGDGKINTLELTNAGKEVNINTNVDSVNANAPTTIIIGNGKKIITITANSKEIFIQGKGIVNTILYGNGYKPVIDNEIKNEDGHAPGAVEQGAVTVKESNSTTSISTFIDGKTRETMMSVIVNPKNGYAITDIIVSGVNENSITRQGNKFIFKAPQTNVTIEVKSIDVSKINAAIEKANAAKKDVKESKKDGSDIDSSSKWVTKEVLKTFEDAIEAAEESKKSIKNTTDIDKVASDLEAAITVFEAALKSGLKPGTNPPTEEETEPKDGENASDEDNSSKKAPSIESAKINGDTITVTFSENVMSEYTDEDIVSKIILKDVDNTVIASDKYTVAFINDSNTLTIKFKDPNDVTDKVLSLAFEDGAIKNLVATSVNVSVQE